MRRSGSLTEWICGPLFLLVFDANPVGAQAEPQGPEIQVNTYTTGNQDAPAVASDASGDFVVVWRGLAYDHSAYHIFGQRYASDGSKQGSAFQVNSTPLQGEDLPS